MILGLCMESPLGSGQAGIHIQDYFLRARELRLASALESASLEDMAGVGTTGDMTGITMASFTTTTRTSPTAGYSSIAIRSIAPADFTVAPPQEDSGTPSMGSRHRTRRLEPIPAPSAVLITEEWREVFPLAGGRALAEALVVVSTEVEVFTAVVTANSV